MNRVLQDSPVVRTVGTGYPSFEEATGIAHELEDGAVHIWSADYGDLHQGYDTLSLVISRDEQKKASKFKKPGDARRWILRHGYLRLVLSSYVGSDPVLLPLVTGNYGKPSLDPKSEVPQISFSLSHTQEMVVLAISKKYDIGIDIVKPDNRYPFQGTTAYLFNTEERAVITKKQPDLQYRQFFRVWALKEALLKASGNDVRMMREADISGIMTDTLLNGIYTVNLGVKDQKCFIRESGCGADHHCALAAIPKTTGEPDT
jgi:phosphopantetheinyl transferase (holo-ACP synthase)